MSRQLRKSALYLVLLLLLLPASVLRVHAEEADVQTPAPPSAVRLPYAFSNFAWWTDAELRAELKARMPGLQDTLLCGSAQEAEIRNQLTAMLRARGVQATVTSVDPSEVSAQVSQFMASLPFFVPEGSDPRPHITFSISAPQIVIGDVKVFTAPDSQSDMLAHIARQMEGKPFDANTLEAQAKQLVEPMEMNGYLSAFIRLSPDQPQRQGDRYVVPLDAAVDAGPVYHVGMVSADGGPLLRGRDLASYFDLHTGDIATPYAFQRLESSIMTIYFQSGYASVHFQDAPILDRDQAIATYRLLVFTGPQYRLRNITMHNLSPAQETEVRNMLALEPGDVYDQVAIDELHQKVEENANLHGLNYSFVPQTDRQHNVIDLTLDFFKEAEQSSL